MPVPGRGGLDIMRRQRYRSVGPAATETAQPASPRPPLTPDLPGNPGVSLPHLVRGSVCHSTCYCFKDLAPGRGKENDVCKHLLAVGDE